MTPTLESETAAPIDNTMASSEQFFTKPTGFSGLRVEVPPTNSTTGFANGQLTPTSHPDTLNRPLQPGVYVPVLTFFTANEDLDVDTIRKHTIRLAQRNVRGLVTHGSNGEAVHMGHKDRGMVTKITRETLDSAGFDKMPIIVGCGAQSVRETVELCAEAYQNGGDFAMILPPSYYKSLYTTESIIEFFNDVADQSPIPILIYNYPPAAGGIDLDSDTITKLAAHPKIVGCKLTCGNTGKLDRIASAVKKEDFYTMAGSCDTSLQALSVGGKGVIGGLANAAPRACNLIYELYAEGRVNDARKAQKIVARGDWAAIQGGVIGTRQCLQNYYGYGGVCRKPLPRPTPEQIEKNRQDFEELMLFEKFLENGCRIQDIHAKFSNVYPDLVEVETILAVEA